MRPEGETVARLSRIFAIEEAYRTASEQLAGADSLQQMIEAHRLDWVLVELDAITFNDEGAAREAILCVREDGLSIQDVGALSRRPVVRQTDAMDCGAACLAVAPAAKTPSPGKDVKAGEYRTVRPGPARSGRVRLKPDSAVRLKPDTTARSGYNPHLLSTGGAVRSIVSRVFVCLAVAVPIALSAQGGQAPTPPPPGQGPVTPLAPDATFTVAVAMPVLEAAPIHIADRGPAGAGFQVINGGVRTVALKGAHAAGNATTQMLRVLGDNPNVRLLFTMVNGNYRIVARRSAGITRLADLKGKRVVVPRDTSANYYLVAMLRSAGLQESDVTLVSVPATAMAAAIAKGDADAISMWEPESENAVRALGADAIIFQDNKIYRELYSVYSTTDVINDPRRRKELVAFVRATLDAAAELQKDPKRYFPLISEMTGRSQEEIARSWEHHDFPLGVAPDLLDLITEEEKWVAAQQKRTPRSRAELARLIDTSILKEARGR